MNDGAKLLMKKRKSFKNHESVGKSQQRLPPCYGNGCIFYQAIKHYLEDESLKDGIIALLLKMERGETGLGGFQLKRNHTKEILL
ncbi:hypothetical protein HID58_023429, partial [Brassica napus]